MIIEATAPDHQPEFFSIESPRSDSTYFLIFVLDTLKDYILNPIIITASQPIISKKDTTVYNASSFVQAGDRKVEDLLRRLPGIDVDPKTGLVKYQGKSIETVLLEGDNLFGYGYTIGTKNINLGIVEQIEAIENYSENTMLKGIENTDKVVLNLKLKSGMIDLSGNIDVGAGVSLQEKLMHNFNGSVMAISKKTKSFGSVSSNNVGVNQSSFDYFSSQFDLDKMAEDDFLAKKVVREIDLSSFVDESRLNRNNLFYSSLNSIHKIGKRSSLKWNFNYVNDRINNTQILNSKNLSNNEIIEYTNLFNLEKKPTLYKGDLHYKINSSPTSLIEYKLQFRPEEIVTSGEVLNDNSFYTRYQLTSDDIYLKNALLYTKKRSENSAFQMTFQNSKNVINQHYIFTPSVIDENNNRKDVQEITPERNYSSVRLTYLQSKGGLNITEGFGFNVSKYDLSSALNTYPNNSSEPVLLSNNISYYSKHSLFNFSTINWKLNKLELSGSYTLSLLNQKLSDQLTGINEPSEHFFIEPSLAFKLNIIKNFSLVGKASYNQFVQNEEFLYRNQILLNNRTLAYNIPNLNLQKRTTYLLALKYSDLENQSLLNLSIRYTENEGNYITGYSISENSSNLINFFNSNINHSFTANLLVERFVHAISTTLRLRSNYSQNNYFNTVNNSFLRNNVSNNLENLVSISTAFDIPINVKNESMLIQNWNFSDVSETINNTFFSNISSIIVMPSERLHVSSSTEFYVPTFSNQREGFVFLDALITYSFPKKNLEVTFVAKNILDKKHISNIQTNDYSTNTLRSNLVRSYYLINFSFNL